MKTTILTLLVLALLATACQELVVNKYEDDPFLYFYRGNFDIYGNGQHDSLIYSFFLKESARQRDTLWVEVRLSGVPSPLPRPVPVIQVPADTLDAVPGRHYIPFDDPEVKNLVMLPANAVKAKVPVIVLRDSSLALAEYAILLEIRDNDQFDLPLPGQERFLLRVSDLATAPPNWTTATTSLWRRVFGVWGAVKMRFIIDHVGFSDFELTSITGDMQDYLKTKARQKLAEYQAINGPLREADGTLVQFPA